MWGKARPVTQHSKAAVGTQLKPIIKNRVENTKWRHLDCAQNNLPGSGSNFCHQPHFRKFKGLPLQGPPMNKDPRTKVHVPARARPSPRRYRRRRGAVPPRPLRCNLPPPPPCRRNSPNFQGGTTKRPRPHSRRFPSTLPALPK